LQKHKALASALEALIKYLMATRRLKLSSIVTLDEKSSKKNVAPLHGLTEW
jgi:hypothetical protein